MSVTFVIHRILIILSILRNSNDKQNDFFLLGEKKNFAFKTCSLNFIVL